MDVPNYLCVFDGNLNSFDHVTFQLLCVLEMNQIRCMLGLISLMFRFPLCNKIFEQSLKLAYWNIKSWLGVMSGDTYNGSAMGKPFSL